MTIREALLAMGYSERKPGHWIKPIGYQCFSFHEEKNEWCNWYRSVDTKIERYETKSFKQDELDPGMYSSFLQQLKGFECWTRTDMWGDGLSQFELEAIDL